MAEDFLEFYGRSGASLSKKSKVSDCGPCHVKLRCSRNSVQVDWPFAGFNLKCDLQAVKVEGFASVMEWNLPSKQWSNKAHEPKPPYMQLNRPSLEFLREMAQACENSQWCCSWDIIVAHGRKVDCDPAEIADLEVEFDEPPAMHHDETTNADIRADIRALMRVRQPTHHTRH